MNIINTFLLKTDEWILVLHTCPAGSEFHPPVHRNGVMMDVPTDPAERSAFQLRYGYAPMLDSGANRVFVQRPFQLYTFGQIQQQDAMKVYGPVANIDHNLVSAYTEASWHERLEDQVPTRFPVDSEFFCCAPRERNLMWERASCVMEPGTHKALVNRNAGRHRIVLLRGSLNVNGVLHDKVAVINAQPGDVLSAVTKVVAVEVWA